MNKILSGLLEHSILMIRLFLIGCFLRAKVQNPAAANQKHCADLRRASTSVWNDSGLASHGSLPRKAINSTSLLNNQNLALVSNLF